MSNARRLAALPLLALLLGLVLPVLTQAPAHAAGRVGVSNEFGSAAIDSKYSTKLTVSGSSFQSIRGGHGGVYVWFGTVSGRWQPSKGGISGVNYKYVPDTESANNAGFQRYVAFPDSDTASSASAVMSANGSWRVSLTVPGPTFKAVGRNGSVSTIDCRKVTCGVITIGAHGVKNANNETFTPVKVADLYQSAPTDQPSAQPSTAAPGAEPAPATDPGAVPDAGASDAPGADAPTVPVGAAAIEVDRTAAVAGRVLAFNASGLPAGQQVSVVFDDGRSGAGPFLVSQAGTVAGVITLPADTPPGTYELRVYGVENPPSVKFAVRAAEAAAVAPVAATTSDDDSEMWGKVFAGFAAAIFLVALARLVLMAVRRRSA